MAAVDRFPLKRVHKLLMNKPPICGHDPFLLTALNARMGAM